MRFTLGEDAASAGHSGDELAFSPVDAAGGRALSHTIRFERGRYRVRDADGMDLGAFATFAAASRAGFREDQRPQRCQSM